MLVCLGVFVNKTLLHTAILVNILSMAALILWQQELEVVVETLG